MLDLAGVAAQVENMVATLKSGRDERQKRLHSALDVFSSPSLDVAKLRRKIQASKGKTTWLVAELVDGLSQHYPAPSVPNEFNVIASDGSHIDVDRHRSTRCFLINIGGVVLRYGAKPDATLDSLPHLYAKDEELVIAPEDGIAREQMVEGTLLGIKRGVEECRRLAELSAAMPVGSSTLALLDGTLILWGLEPYPDFVSDALLTKGLLALLDDMKKLNKDRKLSIASYISYPRSTDVVNTLRVAICPHEAADCDRYCSTGGDRACDSVAGVLDRELFSNALQEGERSSLFISPSKIMKRYGEHAVYFFYLKVDDEIARVEVPEWVAMNQPLLDITHSLLLDQCRRGQGYPVALSEAHEKAVVTGADREQFWELVDSSLVEQSMSTPCSAKSRSKITRWV